MLNDINVQLGKVRSAIRELFEYGKKRKAEIGEENVFDFSLGNPSVPAPEEIKTELINLLQECDPVTLHGYTSAQGDFSVRKVISEYINFNHKINLTPDDICMTCGAAASLCITLNALLNKGDEVIVFAPFFPEYRVFVNHAGGELVALGCDPVTFQPAVRELERSLNLNTKAIIINSPNNPSGVVYGEETVKAICEVLKRHEKHTGNRVFLISDEPYRELVFDKSTVVPYVMNYYEDSIVCYSFSKSLSLPGERIGYIAVNNKMQGHTDVYAGVCGAGRALGYVCAPSLFQRLVAKVLGKTADVSVYRQNRDLLCSALTEYGYTVVKPDGAFYLFVKALEPDANAFALKAREYELLLVPSDSFGVEGYVRISYCVSPETVKNSLPAFKALIDGYKK